MVHPILIVEDDLKIGRVVKVYLEGAGYRAIHVERGAEAIAAAQKETPLLVILDLMLPDMAGEQVCQELRDLGDFPIIMVTARSSEEERVAGFALGADDYVVKPFSPRELVYRVKAVLKRGGGPVQDQEGPQRFNDGLLELDSHRYEARKKGVLLNLTPTEFKILAILCADPGRVRTRDELVDQALGYQFEGYERSIDAHIKNLRQKIEDDPRHPFFILTVYGLGYKFIGKRDA